MSNLKENEFSILADETIHDLSDNFTAEASDTITLKMSIVDGFLYSKKPYLKIKISNIIEHSKLLMNKEVKLFHFNKNLSSIFCQELKIPNMHIACLISDELITLKLSREKKKILNLIA